MLTTLIVQGYSMVQGNGQAMFRDRACYQGTSTCLLQLLNFATTYSRKCILNVFGVL